jgi:uncharacterized protein YjbJ (UPF0337 family)
MMDQAKGTVKDVVGRAQDAFGGAAEDAATQIAGKARQAAGKAQQSYGQAIVGLRDAATSNPIATMAAVAGVGFLLGIIWSRRD